MIKQTPWLVNQSNLKGWSAPTSKQLIGTEIDHNAAGELYKRSIAPLGRHSRGKKLSLIGLFV